MRQSIFLFFILVNLFSCSSVTGEKRKILIIISSASELPLKNGNKYATGYYFNEVIVPAMKLSEQGYELVIANPRGSTPSMDKKSLSSKYFTNDSDFQKAKKFHDKFDILYRPRSFRAILDSGLNQFDALYVPGGHAPMVDLVSLSEMRTILNHFHKNKKPTALLCHGPVALLSGIDEAREFQDYFIKGRVKKAKKIAHGWPYNGYKMTVFSTKEEHQAEESLEGEPLFYAENALRAAGGNVIVGEVWLPNVIVDRELITGQNPASDALLTEKLLEALEK